MKIGILGSGLMGAKLGTLFARAGHEVVFSYARTQEKLATLIRDIGFDPLDLGPLKTARLSEPSAMLITNLAYGKSQGPEIAYRYERFDPQS